MTFSVCNYLPNGWDSLVARCPWGSFYQSSINHGIIKQEIGSEFIYIIGQEVNTLSCGISCSIYRGKFGTVVNCLPYFGSYGDALALPDTPDSAIAAIYEELIDYCRSTNALALNVITSPFASEKHHVAVAEWINPTYLDKRCCQITEIPKYRGEERREYLEILLGTFEGRARTVYRKCERNAYVLKTCETPEQVNEFFEIHRENIGSKGGNFKSKRFFEYVYSLLKTNPKLVDMPVLLDGNRIAGGCVLFYHGSTVEYHTTCLRNEYRSEGILTMIIAQKMADAGMQGFQKWNFGGTWESQKGVYMFKKSFNAKDHLYTYNIRFFRDLDKIKKLSSTEIFKEYPLFFIIPFHALENK